MLKLWSSIYTYVQCMYILCKNQIHRLKSYRLFLSSCILVVALKVMMITNVHVATYNVYVCKCT